MSKKLQKTDVTIVRQVANHIRTRIIRERLKRGALLPSYRELADELSVAFLTAKRAMDVLATEGVVYRQPARGTFVAKAISELSRPLRQLGVIFPATRSSIFTHTYLTEIMRGITLDMPARIGIHIFSISEEGLVNAAQLAEAEIDGVILLGVENDPYLHAFAQWGVPGVVVDYCSQEAPLDFIACDNRGAAQTMVKYLAECGHRRVLYLSGYPHQEVFRPNRVLRRMQQTSKSAVMPPESSLLLRISSDIRERLTESLYALTEHHIIADKYIASTDPWSAQAVDALQQHWRDNHPVTALMVPDNYTLQRLMEELTRRGIRVPDQVSLCAIAADQNSKLPDGRVFTHCRFDFINMGCKAMELLAMRCRNPKPSKTGIHRIGFKFIPGDTVKSVTAPR